MKFTVRPLTPDLWPALEDLFGKNGACNGCWRMYWRIGPAYFERPRENNRSALRKIVSELSVDQNDNGYRPTESSLSFCSRCGRSSHSKVAARIPDHFLRIHDLVELLRADEASVHRGVAQGRILF
jgi:hypothetical protein